ncbi:MAG: Na+:solute symporter [Planctomycetes bacterium]|nr:Na+:solute symporter [Planctomycetota bacterium]
MQLTGLDWTIVIAYVAFALLLAGFFVRRASRGADEFFASGRALPWWLLGTSMVATTFSTDTPNLVTDFVRQKGVAGNWEWWAFLLTGILTVFFYARLWRRSGVLTDLEFYEIRYSGRPAAVVRLFRAVYLGFFFNCVIMASVTLAATKISSVLFGLDRTPTILICGTIAVVFSILSGLWGVVVTDLLLFVFAMVGAVAAAWFALDHEAVGGLSGLLEKIDPSKLDFLPDFRNLDLALGVFIIPIAVQWWSVWYPGSEPGGGSYIAQRILAARNERHALGATFWFNLAHYALRPWPWIIVALCSLLVYPELADIQKAFPDVQPELIGHDIAYPAMLKFLPPGFLGIMVGSLIAAYMSTMDTHLNWGASYIVHDCYRRFLRRDAGEKHYVLMGRIVTAVLMIGAGSLVYVLETARDSFKLMVSIGAGTGLIYLLRWFWWRINAWSEIAAMISSFVIAVGLLIYKKTAEEPWPDHWQLVLSVALTTGVWVIVTLATPPDDEATLVRFYRLVRPFGRGWERIRRIAGLAPSYDSLPHALLGWGLGCLFIYSGLFGTGYFLYGEALAGSLCLVPFAASGAGLIWLVPRIFSTRKGEEASD